MGRDVSEKDSGYSMKAKSNEPNQHFSKPLKTH